MVSSTCQGAVSSQPTLPLRLRVSLYGDGDVSVHSEHGATEPREPLGGSLLDESGRRVGEELGSELGVCRKQQLQVSNQERPTKRRIHNVAED